MSIIEDLANIIDNRYLEDYQRYPIRNRYKKRNVNRNCLMQYYRHETIDFNNTNSELKPMNVDRVYRLPIFLARKIKRQEKYLQLRALLY